LIARPSQILSNKNKKISDTQKTLYDIILRPLELVNFIYNVSISNIMKITICGSMAFAKEMLEIKQKLEEQNHIVIVPTNTDKYADGTIDIENKWEKIELDVIRVYFDEIKKTDAILVTNKDKNNIKNYVGGNSLIEMAFAHVLNKKIFLLNPIPQINYSDEIGAMRPIILNNDLSKIR
jgi:hypothetical protein